MEAGLPGQVVTTELDSRRKVEAGRLVMMTEPDTRRWVEVEAGLPEQGLKGGWRRARRWQGFADSGERNVNDRASRMGV